MRGASVSYKVLMQEVVKPATQVRFREAEAGVYLPLADEGKVDTNIVKEWVVPNDPNYRRYATLNTYGWKVDDSSYICATESDNAIIDTSFITKQLTANTDTTIQSIIHVNSSLAGKVYLKIAPIHCSTLTIKFGQSGETPQEKIIYGADMTDFVTVEFTAVVGHYSLKFNVSEDCRISYYPFSTSADDPVAIFDNSNILSVDIEEYVDLYSQELPRFNVVAKIYDADGRYDPINPQGEFSKFVQDYNVRMLVGYIVGGFIETPFTTQLYLNDTPRYENREITLNFSTTKSADNKYVDALPQPGNPGEPLPNKRWRWMWGLIPVSIDSNGFVSLITDNEMKQLVYSIYGSGYINLPIGLDSIREIHRRASVKSFTAYDIIDKNSIVIERKPVLKALTIKQYSNSVPSTYQETISGSNSNSNYERWSDSDARPYRMKIAIDADASTVCKIQKLSLSGATDMIATWVRVANYRTGATSLQIWIDCASYSPSGTTTYSFGVYYVRQVINDVTESVNSDGENMIINNPFVTDSSLLESCADWVKQVAYFRDYYTFDAIADYRTDVGDWITIDTPYENDVPLFVTDIKYKMPGGTCTITGSRRFSIACSKYSTKVNSNFVTLNGVSYSGYAIYGLVGYFHTTGGRTDVVLVSASDNARLQAPAISYDTNDDGNVITITDSTSLVWHCDIADHSIAGEWVSDGCMFLGTFANVEAAARYLITQAYAEQGYTITLEA